MSVDRHLIEETLSSQPLFKGKLLNAFCDTVRLPDGSTATREYIKHPGAVMVIPQLADGRLLLERQFRYPLDRVFIEFPAGKLDAGEDPLACAQRELLEETGYSAASWEYLGVIHPIISYTDEEIKLYLARDLTAGERQLDDGEFLESITMSMPELIAGVLDGSITDAKTIAGVFWAQQKGLV
ncbi:NUDIX domain-containing protein [Deefgea piscis]|uniref:NUDIX domain-containing protein n=1 Tax=Deefgea piscis TaxID=2739061 RepID=UPI001C80201F|nr:NUDIX hydrolase [Deefgea piscis]QZA80579.1 NUDIX hydrolase [Deefgea piscis]